MIPHPFERLLEVVEMTILKLIFDDNVIDVHLHKLYNEIVKH